MRRQRPVFSLHPCASACNSPTSRTFIFTQRAVVPRKVTSRATRRFVPRSPSITHTRVRARAHVWSQFATRAAAAAGYCSITRNKKRKNKAHRRALVGGETARINEFRRGSDRYRRDRKIQLFSFYFFTTQERFLTSVLIRGIKAITHVVSRLRASERANQRTNARTGTLGLT